MNPFMVFSSYGQLRSSMTPLFAGRILPSLFSLQCGFRGSPFKARREANAAGVFHDANSVDRFLHDANSVNISRDANTANIYLSPSRCQFREGFPRCQFRGHFIAMPIPRRTLTMP